MPDYRESKPLQSDQWVGLPFFVELGHHSFPFWTSDIVQSGERRHGIRHVGSFAEASQTLGVRFRVIQSREKVQRVVFDPPTTSVHCINYVRLS